MPKGYWIAHVDVDDPQAYEAYKKAAAPAFADHGGRFVVRGGSQRVREGAARARTVVIEFPSYTAAQACYESETYQQAITFRAPVATGDLVIVEGHED